MERGPLAAMDSGARPVSGQTSDSSRRLFTGELWQRLLVPVVILAVWTIVTELKLVRPLFLPGPRLVLRAYVDLWAMLPKATLISLLMILSGFVLGSTVGIVSSVIMAYSRTVLNVFGAVFDFLRPVPIFALIPLFILWFGIGKVPQIALIALGCSVILGVTTMESIRNIPNIYVQASYTLGAKRWDVFRTVVIPYIIPHLIGAIRVGAAASFGLDVAAEFMGSQEGLGYLMIVQGQYLKTEGIMAIVIVYSLLALVLDRIIGVVESRITAWTERRSKQAILGL